MADIGKSLPWRSVKAIIHNLPLNSVTAHEISPEVSDWSKREKTNAILADIYDLLGVINANLIALGSGKRPRQPKPYPRPNEKHDNVKKIGRGALPVDELEAFFERKRREHIERNDRSRKSDSDNNPHDGGITGEDH